MHNPITVCLTMRKKLEVINACLQAWFSNRNHNTVTAVPALMPSNRPAFNVTRKHSQHYATWLADGKSFVVNCRDVLDF